MGEQTLRARKGGQIIRTENWFNKIKDILDGDIIPRGNDGAPVNGQLNCGSTSLPWSETYVKNSIEIGAASIRDVSGELIYNKGSDEDIELRDRLINQESLKTLVGLPIDAQDFGTFTGSTIPDNSTYKEAIEAISNRSFRSDKVAAKYLSYSKTWAYSAGTSPGVEIVPNFTLDIKTTTGLCLFAFSHDGNAALYLGNSGLTETYMPTLDISVSPDYFYTEADREFSGYLERSYSHYYDFGAAGTYTVYLHTRSINRDPATSGETNSILNPRVIIWGI